MNISFNVLDPRSVHALLNTDRSKRSTFFLLTYITAYVDKDLQFYRCVRFYALVLKGQYERRRNV